MKKEQNIKKRRIKQIFNMLSAVDIPKSKQVTISYVSIKSTILCCILINNLGQESNCSSRQIQLYSLFALFYKLGFFFDFVIFVYFYLSPHFSKFQFYVFFFIHLFSTLGMLSFIVLTKTQSYFHEGKCKIFSQVKYSCLLINSCFFLNSLWVMFMGLSTGLRLAHFGGNIVWTFLFFISQKDIHIGVSIIGFYHFISALVSFIGVGLGWMVRKSKSSGKIWNIFVKGNIMCLILCYLLALCANNGKMNDYQKIFIKSYIQFGLIQILSPVMCLAFIRVQEGDPRQQILNVYTQLFEKKWENQEFCKQSIL